MEKESTPKRTNLREPAYRRLISSKTAEEIGGQIVDFLFIKKKYKDRDFTARKLAELLGTNTRYVSAVIVNRFHMNYSSLVNKLRIDEAMTLLADARHKDLKMEDISDMVGFSNRQSFYSSFRKFNGMSPRQYRLNAISDHTSMTGHANQ